MKRSDVMRFFQFVFLFVLLVSFFGFSFADSLTEGDFEGVNPLRIGKAVVVIELNGELDLPTFDKEVLLKTFAPQQESPRQKVEYLSISENSEIIIDSECDLTKQSCEPFLLFQWFDVEGKLPFGFKAKVEVDSSTDIFVNPKFPLEDTRYVEFTSPSTYIESDDFQIKSKAESIVEGAETELEAVRRLVEWVHDYVEYDLDYSEKIFSAKEVFELKRGVCDEYGHLFTALARSVGIPTRVVAGYSYTSEIWGYHLWAEVYVPQHGWLPVDPTYNEAGSIDASHIKIATALDNSGIIDSIFSEKANSTLTKESVLSFESIELVKDGFDISLDIKDNAKKSEIVEINVHLKNKLKSYQFVPVTLVVNEDIQILGSSQESQLVLLDSFGEADVVWKVMMPDSIEEGFEHIYTVNVVSPQEIISKEIFLKNENSINGGEIALGETSFSFDKYGFLNAEVEVRNDSNMDVKVTVELQSNGENSEKESVFLISGSKKVVSLSVSQDTGAGFQLVSVVLSTDHGSATKNFRVNFEEQIQTGSNEQEVVQKAIDGTELDQSSIMVLGVLFLILSIVGVLVFRR